jgi:hypothetical protein
MTERTHPVYVGVGDGKVYSVTPRQEDMLWKMQHGRSLVKHAMHCGNPSTYWLQIGGQSELADRRTVASLLRRGLIVLADVDRRARTSTFRVNPNPPAEKLTGVLRGEKN